jgi:DNA-binding response OmpR family regulator
MSADAQTDPITDDLAARYARALNANNAAIGTLTESIARLHAVIEALHPQPRVLIVEDDEFIATQLAGIVGEETGTKTVVCCTADDAMYAAQRADVGDFAAAIIDLDLRHAQHNGITVAHALPRGVAVYFVTGAMPDELERAARTVSAMGAYEKPLAPDTLTAICKQIKARIERGDAPESVH